MTLGVTHISTLIVGKMLAMLPSSKASRAGIRFLSQSSQPRGIQSLESTNNWLEGKGVVNTSQRRKYEWWCISSQGYLGSFMASMISSSMQKVVEVESEEPGANNDVAKEGPIIGLDPVTTLMVYDDKVKDATPIEE